MDTNLRVMTSYDSHGKHWRLYSPTLGDNIGGLFVRESDATLIARRAGLKVITNDDLEDVKRAKRNDHDLTHLAWWVKNCDFEAVRTSFEELVYYEAMMRRRESENDREGALIYSAMGVAASLVLENLAKDLNQWAPWPVWSSYAVYELDRRLANGVREVKCAFGTVELT